MTPKTTAEAVADLRRERPMVLLHAADLTAERLLRDVRLLLADPKAWTQDSLARGIFGNPCHHSDPYASCWCLTGAIDRVAQQMKQWILATDLPAHNAMYHAARDAITDAITDAIPGEKLQLASFNDRSDTRHADVLDVLDRAIDKACHRADGRMTVVGVEQSGSSAVS